MQASKGSTSYLADLARRGFVAPPGDARPLAGRAKGRSDAPPRARPDDHTVEVGATAQPLPRVWLFSEGTQAEAPIGASLLPGQEVVVGTGDDAWLRLSDPTVSARHCRVTHRGATVAIEDLASRNGVRLGGARVTRAELRPGATFELGRTTMRLLIDRASGATPAPLLDGLVGDSAPMRALAASVRKVARLRLPALIRGESGTGKELVARALHAEGPRAKGPFVAINAAAIARELAESELFGHEKGAFTGALRERLGAFREAHRGTLFLDEVAALPLDLQAKLLRVVEEGLVRPLGAESGHVVDVRIVAATCEPLEAMVAVRRFRADLFERLAACVVRVPALRDRPEDIPALAHHILRTSELDATQLAAGALAVLRGHGFPGNVRELRNVLVQAALRGEGSIAEADVRAVLAERSIVARRRVDPEEALRIYEEAGRNVSAAARRAELPRSTMRDLLRVAAVTA